MTIHHWDHDKQTNVPVEITEDSLVELGIEHNPTISIREWMGEQGIETLEDMAHYIDFIIDFNVTVLS